MVTVFDFDPKMLVVYKLDCVVGMIATTGTVLYADFAGQKWVATCIVQEHCGESRVPHHFQTFPPHTHLDPPLVIA